MQDTTGCNGRIYGQGFDLKASLSRLQSLQHMPPERPPKVFISYSRDSDEHNDRVITLADRLLEDGIDVVLDEFVNPPPASWPKWMSSEMASADFIIVVCSANYLAKVEGKVQKGEGRGVKWESLLSDQQIYDNDSISSKFIPVLFNDGKYEDIPPQIRGGNHYRVNDDAQYLKLFRHLTNQPENPKPELKPLRKLPPRQRPKTGRTPTVTAQHVPAPASSLSWNASPQAQPSNARAANTPNLPPPESNSTPNTSLANSLWGLVDKYVGGPIFASFKNRPILASILVIVLAITTVVIWQKEISYENDFFAFRIRGVPSIESQELKDCISRGYKANKDYIMLSTAMSIRVEDNLREHVRHSYYRIVYTILPLKDKAGFPEQYTTGNRKAAIAHWYGSETEIGHTDTSYDVKFSVKKGTPYTLITGADYTYPLPLDPNRKAAAEILTLSPNEEFYSYPNQEDEICKLSILIESPTTKLKPAETEAGLRYTLAGNIGNIGRSAAHFVEEDDNGNKGSLSAHWDNVKPGEEVGIHFKW